MINKRIGKIIVYGLVSLYLAGCGIPETSPKNYSNAKHVMIQNGNFVDEIADCNGDGNADVIRISYNGTISDRVFFVPGADYGCARVDTLHLEQMPDSMRTAANAILQGKTTLDAKLGK